MPSHEEKPAEERNQPATPFRREEFRKSGQVAMSRELLSVFLLMGVGGTLYLMMSRIFQEFTGVTGRFFSTANWGVIGKIEVTKLVVECMQSFGWIVGPVLATAVVVGVLVSAVQVGLYVTWEPLTPNWGKLNPVNGMKRLLSARGSVEALKAIFKLTIALTILWLFLRSQSGNVGIFLHQGVPEIVRFTLTSVAKLFFMTLFILLALAILDYGFQRWQLEKEMRMTRQEAKEEFKLREGDPMIKSRIRSIQRRIASQRMMEEVPKADVVVTNPTHFAVALKYDRQEMPAPKVSAKGAGVVAQKIKEVARANGVPIVENKPLARAMFKEIEIGHFVPRELYKAVAEVLAYVYRLKGMGQVANA